MPTDTSEKVLETLITSKPNGVEASRNPGWNCCPRYWMSSTRPGGTSSATPTRRVISSRPCPTG